MKLQIMGALGATALMVCGAIGSVSAAVVSQDQTFVTKAAQGGAAEVADGQLALSKDASPRVKMIAQHMVTDHAKANDKLASIAEARGMKVPRSPSMMDDATMLKQKVLSGNAFSSAYLHDQQAAHQQTIALFKQEIASGQDPQLVAFAKMTLPTIEQHLSMIDGALAYTH
jgi:putative membrane protein